MDLQRVTVGEGIGIDGNIARNNTSQNEDITGPLFFSSERFSLNEDDIGGAVDSIDNVSNLFTGFKKKSPTLEEALESMGYEKYKELSEMFIQRGEEKLKEFNAPGLTAENIGTIICYTYQWDNTKFGEDDSPYRKLNNSLSVDRSSKTLKNTRYFLFLLLQVLRKLPRFLSPNRLLYRGIKFLVQTEFDPKFPERKPYATGCEKMWWTFTSTTMSLEATQEFIGEDEGTLFTLSGETWGYNISMFSDFPDEKEILLEPERRLSIASVHKEGKMIDVNAKILDTHLVLKDIIKVGKTVTIKENDKIEAIPKNLRIENVADTTVELAWDDVKINRKVVSYQVSVKKIVGGLFSRNVESIFKTNENKYIVENLEKGTGYEFRVRCEVHNKLGNWSENVNVTMFSWKECPNSVDAKMKYCFDNNNPKTAKKIGQNNNNHCTIIGNTSLLPNKVTSWNVKLLKSLNNDGREILIGVAPSNINQNDDDNYSKCGWYYACYASRLWSGPPHNYRGKEYGPRKREGSYVHTGNKVSVVMDTTSKGELSFIVNGVNYGVSYSGIPIDKPLVPCVILGECGDSVELDLSEVKENINTSVPTPFGITSKSDTWDSITFSWDDTKGASFYQAEFDESKYWDVTTETSIIKRGLSPYSDHSIKIRTVKDNNVSKWSEIVKGEVRRKSFEGSWWKECPADIDEKMRYTADIHNPRIAKKVDSRNYNCTIIGNTPLSSYSEESWNIKILESGYNNGYGIYVGVAPFDINQNEVNNFNNCGWYYYCCESTLWSGPPHNYESKVYGPRKMNGEYIHTGNTIGVIMNMKKGILSFILNGVNHGVAYENIPLDKPLVPCVLLKQGGDSIELDTSIAKENEDQSIPVPSTITTKSDTWDSITIAWGAVEGASFYQIEVDDSKFWDITTTNSFTKRGFLPETKHFFKIRAVKDNSVGKWSFTKVGLTRKKWIEYGWWEECTIDGNEEKSKYSVNKDNPRIATKSNGDKSCLIKGNTPLPRKKIVSWDIKVLNSKNNNGSGIFIGVAPSDTNQNEKWNTGWYFHCYNSLLFSSSPHNYMNKEYGPRKEDGSYVRTGDIITVIMDTTNGELSFALNGVDLGVAYKRIPLGKTFVPCVVLSHENDSVELDFIRVKEKERKDNQKDIEMLVGALVIIAALFFFVAKFRFFRILFVCILLLLAFISLYFLLGMKIAVGTFIDIPIKTYIEFLIAFLCGVLLGLTKIISGDKDKEKTNKKKNK